MVALAARLRERNPNLLDRDEWFCNYINPFELLNIPIESASPPSDPKTLQRLRKTLLSEIELEEGRVEWMPGLRIDRSRAIGLCEEISTTSTVALYHAHVFTNPALLRFLSRGDLAHFMVHERDSPVAMMELLESPPEGFQDWLDDVFARQFNLVFSKAIEKHELLAVEVLLDGRRWVSLEAADRCFEGAFRQVDRLLDPLRQYAGAAPRSKPSVKRVQKLLADDDLGTLLSLLPLDFHEIQDEAIGLLRDIAVASYNMHEDADLAHEIVRICLDLPFKSAVLKHKLHEDMQHLTELIEEERKDEVRLKVLSAQVRRLRCVIGNRRHG